MSESVLDKATAEIDRSRGRAVIVEPDGKIYILDVRRGNTLQDGAKVSMGMFLQPDMAELEFREAGEYPHEELVSYVKLAHTQEQSLMLLFVAIDPQHSAVLRNDSAKLLLEFMKEDKVKSWLTDRLTAFPLSQALVDIDGLQSEELKSYLGELT